MKTGEQQSSTAVGLLQTQAFQIKTSPKAFEILSSGIYSDKLLAPIRELSTNAWDAHRVVGRTDQPFEVTIPTDLSPVFRVRDFGPGISEEQVMSLYTTYFESTKSDSNDYIGCLGLGSKSPFAYTDSFTVESYQGGVVKTYAAHLVQGLPSISKVAEYETNEPDGLAVSFAVQTADVQKFYEKASKLYSWFTVKPKTNVPLLERFKDNSTGLMDTSEMYLKSVIDYAEPAIHVVMGEIAYPVRGLDIGINDHLYKGLVLRADIGDVDIATSREALGFTERTKAWIRAKLDVAPKVFAEEVVAKELEDQESWWAAWRASQKFREYPLLSKIGFSYKGEELPVRNLVIPATKVKLVYLNNDREKKVVGRDGILHNYFDLEKLTFYKNDVKQGFVKRLVQKGDPNSVLVTLMEGCTVEEACNLLHIRPEDLQNISTLDYVRDTRGKSTGPLHNSNFIELRGLTDHSAKGPVYVMSVRRGQALVNERPCFRASYGPPSYGVRPVVAFAQAQGWIPKNAQIYGVPANLYERALHNGCKDLFKEIWEHLKIFRERNPQVFTAALSSSYQSHVNELLRILDPSTVERCERFRKMAELSKRPQASAHELAIVNHYHVLTSYFGGTTAVSRDARLDKLWTEWVDVDPLGKVWNQGWNTSVKQTVAAALKERTELKSAFKTLQKMYGEAVAQVSSDADSRGLESVE